MRRVVVDTNVLVSALLFRGETATLCERWREGRVRLLLSSEILLEYARVLAYPKFRLSEQAVAGLLSTQVLPFADSLKVVEGARLCRDLDDDKFVWCAECGQADALITGDLDLLALRTKLASLVICTPAEENRALDQL